MIPATLTLDSVQAAFRDIEAKIKPLTAGNLDLRGRRIVGAGSSVQPFDYVVRDELDRLSAELQDAAPAATPIRASAITLQGVSIGVYSARPAAASNTHGLFMASDRGYVSWVSDGLVWRYFAGHYTAAVASRPADLGANDVGFLFRATDIGGPYFWDGAAWRELFDITTAGTNNEVTGLTIARRSSGTPAAGFGNTILFQLESANNTARTAATMVTAWSTATNGSETAFLSLRLRLAGVAAAEIARLTAAGWTVPDDDYDSGWDGDLTVPTKNAVYDKVEAVIAAEAAVIAAFYPHVTDTINLTNRTTIVTATNYPGSSGGGLFRVSYYLADTAADVTAGTIQFKVSFTDDAGATSVSSAAVILTAAARTSGVFFVSAAGNVAYETILTGIFGTSAYALHTTLERLG